MLGQRIWSWVAHSLRSTTRRCLSSRLHSRLLRLVFKMLQGSCSVAWVEGMSIVIKATRARQYLTSMAKAQLLFKMGLPACMCTLQRLPARSLGNLPLPGNWPTSCLFPNLKRPCRRPIWSLKHTNCAVWHGAVLPLCGIVAQSACQHDANCYAKQSTCYPAIFAGFMWNKDHFCHTRIYKCCRRNPLGGNPVAKGVGIRDPMGGLGHALLRLSASGLEKCR